MKLSVGFSPCPNDTFIFDAMIHGKIDTMGLEFDVQLGDVAELNRLAFEQKLDVTKLSYHAFGHLQSKYKLLNAGSALGNNCGPLLIAKNHIPKDEIMNRKIAIPGKFTTAFFLFKLAFPKANNFEEMLFSDIEGAVIEGKVDAGLIIHENRFTYQDKGLVKIIDLGEFWETKEKMPIPLGGIAIRRDIDYDIMQTFDNILRSSIEYAFENPESGEAYVRAHAQEMSKEVMYKHINLYVNKYSIDLGNIGKKAIHNLLEKGAAIDLFASYKGNIFV